MTQYRKTRLTLIVTKTVACVATHSHTRGAGGRVWATVGCERGPPNYFNPPDTQICIHTNHLTPIYSIHIHGNV